MLDSLHSFSLQEEETNGLQYIIQELYNFLNYVHRKDKKSKKNSQAIFTEKSMPCFGLDKPIAPQQPKNSHICAITTTMYLFDTVKYHHILLTESNRRQNFQNIAEICNWERMNDNDVSKTPAIGSKGFS